ncbi:MAG: DUF2071 domain-containing protein [Bdellovibrionia bacterium]
MVWHDLAFLHWRVPVSILRPLIPSALEIDTFDGSAWIGVVPFSMSDVYMKGLNAFSLRAPFCELNVRTYVSANGKPGVWFFSLDTESILTIVGARASHGLPYYFAKMSDEEDGGSFLYSSKRVASRSEFVARYSPKSEISHSKKGSIEYWLTERYVLYAQTLLGKIGFAEIDHVPWPLQTANCEIHKNTMHHTVPGLAPLKEKPLVHFAKRLEVTGWSLESLGQI